MLRSSHRRCSVKISIYKKFAKFTRNHLCQGLSFNKVAGLRSANLLKRDLWHMCFPVNFAKFLRTPFLQDTSGRLLLHQKYLKKNICLYYLMLSLSSRMCPEWNYQKLLKTNLKKRTLKKLLIDKDTKAAFSYDNIYYQQWDGIWMDS